MCCHSINPEGSDGQALSKKQQERGTQKKKEREKEKEKEKEKKAERKEEKERKPREYSMHIRTKHLASGT